MQKNPELNTFLIIELGFLKKLKETEIRFNPKPFSKKQEAKKEKLLDFDIEVIKKINDTINQNNNNEKITEIKTTSTEQNIEPIVEIRQPWNKTPEPPQFTPMINIENTLETTIEKQNNDIQAMEFNTNINFEEKKEDRENINSIVFTSEKIKKTVSTLGRIRIRKKENITKNNNGLTKTKKELEKTVEELEKKKKELEEMEQLAKQKEEELKKKKEERKKQEKLKKLEEKRKLKEAKRKEREQKRLEREKQKELKKLEKQKLLEQKIKEKEEQKKKKLEEKQRLLAELEKKKQLEKQKKEQQKTMEKKPLPFFKIIEKKVVKPAETKKQPEPSISWDEEVSQAITIIDNLLEQLPEETIDKFVQSDDFEIYERVVKKYKQNK